jgi:phage shock protein PspC (stress-responsive transcriptional regulator)
MSTTPPDIQQPEGGGQESGPRVGWDDIRDLGRIRRVTHDRRVAGVAGGLARHLDIDPLILRVAFVVLTFFAGVGLLLYLACWLLVPEEGSDWATVALDRRSRAVALGIVGVLALALLVSHGWWGFGFPWAILVVVGIVAVVVSQWGHRGERREQQPQPQPQPPAAYSPYGPVADPTQAAPTWTPSPPVQPRPVNPRKKGPILFWFTLGVIAVALGALAVVDLSGVSVTPSAYPALALAITAVALLVGAFWGRAGGLILVGLITSLALVFTTVADRWDPHRAVERPVTASTVRPSYHIDTGELVLDLTRVRDVHALDNRTVTISGGIGHLDIRVPPGLSVNTRASISGPGGINDFGQETGGIGTSVSSFHDAGPHTPVLTIVATLHVGAIDLHSPHVVTRSLP